MAVEASAALRVGMSEGTFQAQCYKQKHRPAPISATSKEKWPSATYQTVYY